jgi:hypothetical protein
VHDLHRVFPATALVAISKTPGRRAQLTRLGAVAVSPKTPAAHVAALLRDLLRK